MKELYKLKAPVQIDMKVFDKWKMIVNNTEKLFEYVDGEKSDNQIGIKVNCVILEDNYEAQGYTKNANRYEKITFKVLGENDLNLFKIDEEVKPVAISKAIVYGDYNNQLSIECKLMNAGQYAQRKQAQGQSRR